MQYTPQQLSGHKGYNCRTLVGNWNEDVAVADCRLQTYIQRRENNGLLSQKLGSKFKLPMTPITLTPMHDDGFVHYDDIVMVQSVSTETFLCVDPTAGHMPRANHWAVTSAKTTVPTVRFAFTIRRVAGPNDSFYSKQKETHVLHYGEKIRLVNENCIGDGHASLKSQAQTPNSFSLASKRQEVSACLSQAQDSIWLVVPADRKIEFEMKGEPVTANTPVVLRHAQTNTNLSAENQYRVNSMAGQELEICCHNHKLAKTKHDNLPFEPPNLWALVSAPAGASFAPFSPGKDEALIDRVKARILARGGSEGFRGIIRTLRLFDNNGDRKLDRVEFKEGMMLYGIELSVQELDAVFKVFDRNGDGVITIQEFLRTLRGEMNDRRYILVQEAYKRIDLDLSGMVTFDEIKSIYSRGLSRHPEVVAGTKSPDQVLKEFILCWDKNGDATVTSTEFTEYYHDISANIDDDDYFELMIRNAWHMSGGEGWCENTSCRRVLVTHTDGRQTVQEIKNDLGITKDDIEIMRERLIKQGVTDIQKIELYN